MNSEKGKRRKGFAMPDTYVIVFFLSFLMMVLTYVVPAGVFNTVKDAVTGISAIDPASYHGIASQPVGIMQFLNAFPRGFTQSGSIIAMVLILGGACHIVRSTGAIDSCIALGIRKFQDRMMLLIPIVGVASALLGAAGILANATIAFVPIGMVFAKRLGLDPIIGMATVYLSAFAGFSTSPISPSSVLIAQEIAQIPRMSGLGFRTIAMTLVVASTVFYLVHYSEKVRKDPSKSLMPEFRDDYSDGADKIPDFVTPRQWLVLAVFAGGLALYIWGSVQYRWSIDNISAIFLAIAILTGVIMKISPNELARLFVSGARQMLYGAILIGFAKAISVVMSDGAILHTIVYWLSKPLATMGAIGASIGMFFANLVFNFFIPSNSGQAVVVMPLMAPMADLLGITRQMAITAYQFGSGFCDVITPTSGVLMACLGVAGIPYDRWLRWIAPLFFAWSVIGIAMLTIGVMLGLS